MVKRQISIGNTSRSKEDILNEMAGMTGNFYQGDIVLSERQLAMMERNKTRRSKRQAYKFANKWTNNKVYFFFDATFNDETKRQAVRNVHKHISSKTCIDFEESSTAPNRVRVLNDGGCHSQLGMEGGEYILSLTDWCISEGSIGHEFAHALGFLHEHSRTDRDDFVTIHTNNINPAYKSQFNIMWDTINYTPFEYGSFMLYGAYFFSGNGQITIDPEDQNYLFTMSNKQITFYDFMMINAFYGCDAKCPATTSAKCENGGKPNPRNCAVCNCPQGYGGTLCEQRPPGCGESLNALPNWQRAQLTIGNDADLSTRAIPTVCTSWITAPPGKLIEVTILKMENPQCHFGCQLNGFEIKGEDKLKTNPRYCCDAFNDQPTRSVLNPTPVISYNRLMRSSFLFEYRYVDGGTPDFTKFIIPLKRFYKHDGGYHRYHSDPNWRTLWLNHGMVEEGSIGGALSPQLYAQNKAQIDAECGSLVLIRAFYKTYMVLTPDPGFANGLANSGWQELPPMGYCSATPTCGAVRPMRSVSALDGSTSVYSTASYEIDVLNTFDRFKGTASGVICYLF